MKNLKHGLIAVLTISLSSKAHAAPNIGEIFSNLSGMATDGAIFMESVFSVIGIFLVGTGLKAVSDAHKGHGSQISTAAAWTRISIGALMTVVGIIAGIGTATLVNT